MRAAAVDRDGKMLAKVVHPTPLDSSEHIVDDIAKSILEVRAQMGPDGLVGTGVAVPGFIDMNEGVVIGWSKLPGMNRFPMKIGRAHV